MVLVARSRCVHIQVYRKHFVDAALEQAPTTPGMKYRHYSPNAPIVLLDLTGAHQPLLPAPEAECQQPAASRVPMAATSRQGVAALRAAADRQLRLLLQEEARSAGAVWGGGPEQGHEHGEPQQAVAAREPLAGGVTPASSLDEQQGRVEVAQGARSGCRRLRVGVLRTSCDPHAAPGLTPGDQSHRYALHTMPAPPEADQAQAGEELGQQGQGCMAEVREYVLGALDAPGVVARELFVALRLMDDLGVDLIVAEGVVESDEGLAVMNRLRKAASRVVPFVAV